jgi:hypothetical protein
MSIDAKIESIIKNNFRQGNRAMKSSMNEIEKSINAVERLSLRIKRQIIKIGAITGITPPFQSSKSFSFLTNSLDKYISKASLAKSED